MQEIKVGDFVWHEGSGKGICIDHREGWLKILFENGNFHTLPEKARNTLFKKGDLVVGRSGNLNIEYYGTFTGWSDFTEERGYDFLSVKSEKNSLFVHNLRHQEEQVEINLTLKVNGKEVSPSSLSEETWKNLRSPK